MIFGYFKNKRMQEARKATYIKLCNCVRSVIIVVYSSDLKEEEVVSEDRITEILGHVKVLKEVHCLKDVDIFFAIKCTIPEVIRDLHYTGHTIDDSKLIKIGLVLGRLQKDIRDKM